MKNGANKLEWITFNKKLIPTICYQHAQLVQKLIKLALNQYVMVSTFNELIQFAMKSVSSFSTNKSTGFRFCGDDSEVLKNHLYRNLNRKLFVNN